MQLRCKQGDLAFTVKSKAGNEGKIVKCIRYIGQLPGWVGDDYWEIDVPIVGRKGKIINAYRDGWMRPLRDSDGDDEMVRIAGIPNTNDAVYKYVTHERNN